ncbi:hypothetical protein GQ53DRAFT_746660 [Thozetella sp. PMI_491]|nr:hypothetical protein GQ53DRAFT_746660 [Thozetella sp. PMI_491]
MGRILSIGAAVQKLEQILQDTLRAANKHNPKADEFYKSFTEEVADILSETQKVIQELDKRLG